MTEANNYQGYQEFNKRIDTLGALIEEQISIVRSLKMPIQEANLKKLKEIVQSTNFKVMVLGEFKRGKSTFINALLGKEVLPAYSTPCTAIINESNGAIPSVLYYTSTKLTASLHHHLVMCQSIKLRSM